MIFAQGQIPKRDVIGSHRRVNTARAGEMSASLWKWSKRRSELLTTTSTILTHKSRFHPSYTRTLIVMILSLMHVGHGRREGASINRNFKGDNSRPRHPSTSFYAALPHDHLGSHFLRSRFLMSQTPFPHPAPHIRTASTSCCPPALKPPTAVSHLTFSHVAQPSSRRKQLFWQYPAECVRARSALFLSPTFPFLKEAVGSLRQSLTGGISGSIIKGNEGTRLRNLSALDLALLNWFCSEVPLEPF